jgi:hypothetical protein
MGKSKLLFITHEMSPFLELTKIAEITRQLPQAMQEKGSRSGSLCRVLAILMSAGTGFMKLSVYRV